MNESDELKQALETIDNQNAQLMISTQTIDNQNAKILQQEETINIQKEVIKANGCLDGNTSTDSSSQTDNTDSSTEIVTPTEGTLINGIKILIEMDETGNYTIKEWTDPNKDYELDGMFLEIFKNDEGRYQLI